jgi:tripartite-type tricarboxylate transporter receptor subunit TctC
MVAPPGTSPGIADTVNRDVVTVLQKQDVAALLRRISLEPGATTRSETAQFFADETSLWSSVIKEAGIEPQ